MDITPVDYFEAGRLARERGLPTESCPLRYKAWPYDCWQMGWQFAELEANVNNGKAWEGELVDNQKTAYEQGQLHQMQGRQLRDCPFEPGNDNYREWRMGWIAQFNEPTREIETPEQAEGNYWLLSLILYVAILIACLGVIVAFYYMGTFHG